MAIFVLVLVASALVGPLAASMIFPNSRLALAASTFLDSERAQRQGRTWPMHLLRWGGFATGLAVVVLLAMYMPAIAGWTIGQLAHS